MRAPLGDRFGHFVVVDERNQDAHHISVDRLPSFRENNDGANSRCTVVVIVRPVDILNRIILASMSIAAVEREREREERGRWRTRAIG